MKVWPLPVWRVVAIAAVFTSVLSTGVAGEPIIFSKPDRDIVRVKPPAESGLPDNESHSLRFAPQPAAPTIPYVPPQPVGPPRKIERRTLFDTPELFSDRTPHNPESAARQGMNSSFFVMPFEGVRESEPERALSPIRQYDWTPDVDPNGKTSKDTSEARHRFESGMMGRSREDERNFREESVAGFFGAAQKRELTRGELDRKAEWEQLLHATPPSTGPQRALGSAPTPQEVARMPMPLILQPEPSTRPSLDPMQAYNDQQRRWRGPSVDDMNRRAFGLPASTPEKAPEVDDRRTPLMRQPTIQDFPARRF